MAKLFRGDLFAPVTALAVATVALLVGAIVLVTRDADKAAVVHEEAVISHGLDALLTEFAMVADQMAQEPLSPSRPRLIGRQLAMVVDAEGAPLAAYTEQSAAAPETIAPFTPSVARLVRALHRARQTANANAEDAAGQRQIASFSAVGPNVFVLTATLIEDGEASPILITADSIDDQFLSVLRERFMLEDVRLHRSSGNPAKDRARISIFDSRGRDVAILSWQPHTPGADLLRKAMPPLLLLVGLLIMIGYLLYRRARDAARRLKASEARATHLAYHDALTGLPNRLLFADRLGVAIEDARRRDATFAVHCIDLDRFKEVNDTFGHHVGDELIRLAASRISEACRSADTVARLGGDEFAVLQADTDSFGAGNLADRVVTALSAPMELSVGKIHIGASIGVTLASQKSDADECMRQADLALYRVKDQGRGAFCFFEEEMDATIRYRRSLQADLHEAIENKTLELHYQPQVNGNGDMVGVEALLRWTHPRLGPVAPSVFVPIAEECGLIDALGFFTLQRAFEDSRRWPHLRIAVNISAAQLRMRGFAERLALLTDEMGVRPARFELEITEGVLLGDDPQTRSTLMQIRELGFSLTLDDFGTGYSSLGYLQRYPIDKIKIDRSFIAQLGVHREGEAVVAAIVRLARALHLAVIAEGVETNEQRLRLARAGCNEVQGFLFGRPTPASAIDAMLAPKAKREPPAMAAAG